MNPLALFALVPAGMVVAMFLFERSHARVAVRVRSDGRRVSTR